MTVKSTIKHRRGTTAQWESRNPILKDAEFGVNLDTGKFKVGNGVSRWLDLLITASGVLPGQTMDVNFGDVVKRYVLVASGGSGTTYQPNVWMPDEA